MGAQPALTTSQLKRLGRQLRHETTVSDEDLALLQQLREEHFDLLGRTQQAIRAVVPSARATSRLKTVQTIVEKLQREPSMALDRMRDIAGLRIVDEMDRDMQDVLVSEVRDAVRPLGTVTIIDRRRRPSHGYRAVHLELRADRRYVEIQVRTRRQDQWAQIVESLGDTWGRGIRYGRGPEDPDRTVGRTTRRELWEAVQALAEEIDRVERPMASLGEEETWAAVLLDQALDLIAGAARAGKL